MKRSGKSELILALDVDNMETAGCLVRKTMPYTDYFKIGLEMITAVGAPQAINYLQSYGARRIFFDGKFHDIPNTVGKSVKAAAGLGVAMISVHASSDSCDSLKAAADNKGSALICAVIELTSSGKNLDERRYDSGATFQDVFLGRISKAKEAGADGIICSARYLSLVNSHKEFDDLLRVTPGIRTEWASKDDHKKFSTPAQAVENGSDFLVIGRPIINPPKEIGSSKKAIELIMKEMESAEC